MEYRQACPNGYCWMCAEVGYLRGNGSAQTNPTPKQGVASTTPAWEWAVRQLEDSAPRP